MNESTVRRRIWIRNFIILFLAALLLLTLFSNTILNRSLPEVAVRYPQYASISSRIRASASVTANQSFSVTIPQTRTVAGVDIRVGQTVQKGDTIMRLEPGDSDELDMLRREAEDLELQLLAKLQQEPEGSAGTDDGTVRSLKQSLADAQDALADQRLTLSDAEYTLSELKTDLSDLQSELAGIRARQEALPTADDVQSAQAVIARAEETLRTLNAEHSRLEAKRAATGDSHYYTETELEALIARAEYELAAAKDAYAAAFDAYDKALRLADSLAGEAEAAQAQYEYAEAALNDYRASMPQEVTYEELLAAQQAVTDAQKAVEDTLRYYTRAEYTAAKTAYDAAKKEYDSKFGKVSAEELAELKAVLEEKEAALQALEPKEEAYQNALAGVQRAQQEYWAVYARISQASGASEQLRQLQETASAAKERVTALNAQLTAAENARDRTREENDRAQAAAEQAENTLDALRKYENYDELTAALKGLEAKIEQAEKEKAAAEETLSEASEENVSALTREYQSKEREIAQKERSITAQERTVSSCSRAVTAAQQQIASLRTQIEEAQAAAEKNAEAAGKAAELEYRRYQIELQQIKDALEKKEAEIRAAEEKEMLGTVTSPVSGIVESIYVAAGNKAEANTPLVSIVQSDMGYTMQCTVTSEQAAGIRVGDAAAIQWYYWGEAPSARIVSIKSDPSSQGRQRIVTLEVTGEVSPGTQLTFTLGEKNASYDCVVPKSAVREDTNGNFVLIVTARSTPLGNRYTARRVEVQVLASDETNAAISGAVSGEYVITASSTPISDGMQVRLSDNTN